MKANVSRIDKWCPGAAPLNRSLTAHVPSRTLKKTQGKDCLMTKKINGGHGDVRHLTQSVVGG